MSILRFAIAQIIYVDYDNEADSAYIKLREGKVYRSKDITDDKKNTATLILDFDSRNHLLGVELIGVSEFQKKQSSNIFAELSARYHTPMLKHINTTALANLYS